MLTRRTTILRICLFVLVAAVDLAMLRDWYISYNRGVFVSGFVVFEFAMINLLGLTLDRAVFSGDERRSFSRGFFLCGMIPLIAVSLYSVTHTREQFFRAVWPMLNHWPYTRRVSALLGGLGVRPASVLGPMFVLAMMTAVYSIPQVAIAGFGGVANLLAWRVSRQLKRGWPKR